MAFLNRAEIIGNVGRKPELRYTPDGDAVTNVSVATTKKYKDRNGNLQETTEWHRVSLWGKQAETAAKYLDTGSQVYFSGELKTKKYTGTDGVDRYSTEIAAREMQFLGSRGDGQNSGGRSSGGAYQQNNDEYYNDDVPF